MIKSPRVRVFLGLMLALILLVILVAVLQRRSGHYSAIRIPPAPTPEVPTPTPEISTTPTPEAIPASPSPQSENTPQSGGIPSPATPSPTSTSTSTSEPTATPSLPIPSIGFVGTLKLIIPVAGVKPEQLQDTFADSRSEGRAHDAIDIPAAAGTPVLAAANGQIVKLFQSERGGTTIYQLSAKKLIFYYAHLQSYADGLYEGKMVRQGEVIAHVGDTGNAGPGNYHLHFSIMVVSDPKRYWEGVNINPYPLLRN